MLIALIVSTCFGALALGAACLAWGLYVGERGRRIAAENRVTFGTPTAAPARQVTPERASEELVRDIGKPFAEETLEAGVKALRAEYASIGRKVTDTQLREEVQGMLYGGAPFGAEPDL